ncbi:MAG TPA: dihydrodipicolinate synthase family protein [Candidatus Dormibacteraeota bacterium]|jgi:4-hydroxy-tetrahydrodipicolinate synthase|nr:dihydrodipicolinate synthase family protein [Candidatus Dormibacteraeota bacterium]
MILLCRNATTFGPQGELDEEAYRASLQRFVDAGLGVYMASGGSGEGHSLSWDELGRVYRIGVEVCRGKVPVNSNQPEQHTAAASLVHARLAVEAGVDTVNIYGPAGWHGYRPTDGEYLTYFDRVLPEIQHPVALCPNPILGYTVPAPVIARICNRYRQVSALNLSGISSDAYLVGLREELDREVDIYVGHHASLNALAMGASGLLGAEANLIPGTFRRYLDLYEAGELEELGRVYADITRVAQFVGRWKGGSPRWIKMAMRVFGLPGGEGGVREPYLMPPAEEIARFAEGAIALHVPEIDDLARAAGS